MGDGDVELVLGEDPALELVTNEQAGRSVTPEVASFRWAWLSSRALHPLPKMEAMP